MRKHFRRLTTLRPQPRQLFEVRAKNRVRADAILQALQVPDQLGSPQFGQRVNDPVSAPGRLDHPAAAEVSQVLGHLHLWFREDLLKVANAQRPLRQQMEQTQTRPIAEAFVDLDQIHAVDLATRSRLRDVHGFPVYSFAPAAARITDRNAALLLRETIGVLFAELKLDRSICEDRARQRKLRDRAIFVLHFDPQVVVRQDAIAELENLRQGAPIQSVVDIVRHPSLEQAGIRRVMQCAAAIDESLRYMADFGDVKMGWDCVSIRQDKLRERLGVQRE